MEMFVPSFVRRQLIKFFLVAAYLLSAALGLADDIRTTKGEVFKDVQVTAVQPGVFLVVQTQYGTLTLPFNCLSKETQQKYQNATPAGSFSAASSLPVASKAAPTPIVSPTTSSQAAVSHATPTPKVATGQVAENGSYYGELNKNGVPKTVPVRGYYRKDGTYVRGHYRSPPGSNP
jgi:hypothetical protein